MKRKEQTQPMNVRIPLANIERLKQVATRNGLAVSDLVRIAVNAQLARWEKKKLIMVN